MPPKKKKGKGGGKKKGKKKALSPEEKLEAQHSMFVGQEELHEAFLRRVNVWMLEHHSRAIDLFRRFDTDISGSLNYAEFFAGMRDLDAPCTELELYALAKAVDKDNNGSIDYNEFSAGLKYERPVKVVVDDGLPVLKIMREEREKCPHCNVDLWTPSEITNVKYICLEVKLVTFLQIRSYPGHFQVFVHAHMLVSGIVDMIKERHGGTFRFLQVFYENEEGLRVLMNSEHTLEQSGFPGGPRNSPQVVNIFYEFEAELSECPLLQCDHYFISDKLTPTKSTESVMKVGGTVKPVSSATIRTR